MTFRPLGKKVLVAENKRNNTTESGIIIEGADRHGDSRSGTVLAIGPDVAQVQVGDKILLDWSKSAITTVDGAQRVIVLEENIVAVLEN